MKKLIAGLLTALIICSAAVPASATAALLMNLKLSNTKQGVKLSWSKVKGAKKYTVYRSSSASKKTKKLKIVKGTSFTDKNAKSGKKYWYSVMSDSKNGGQSSRHSILRLKAPANFKAKLQSDDDYFETKLTWSKVKGAKSYEVFRQEISAKKTGKFTKIDKVKKPKYEDYYLPSGSYYRYKVRAVNGKTKGAFSSVSKKTGYMETPVVIATHNEKFDAVRLFWDYCEGAEGYKIYKSVDKGKSYKLVLDSKKLKKKDDTVSWDDSDVKLDNVYYYYVIAYNKLFSSKKSEDNIASVVFRDYDIGVQIGEEKTEPTLSLLCNQLAQLASLAGSKLDFTLKSEDESVAKVEVRQNDDKSYSVVITGVSEGYADINLNLDSLGSVYSAKDNDKLRIKVSKDPIYDMKLKAGETEKLYSTGYMSDSLISSEMKINVTSSDEKIVRVNDPTSAKFTLTGVSAGAATITVTLSADFGIVKTDYRTMEYKILVE